MERVDEKGKVVTIGGHVHGYLHVPPGRRVKDQLNMREEQFLALTDATMQELDGQAGDPIGFIAINKDHIISVMPIDEPRPASTDEHYYS
jgi:hypothetical protein